MSPEPGRCRPLGTAGDDVCWEPRNLPPNTAPPQAQGQSLTLVQAPMWAPRRDPSSHPACRGQLSCSPRWGCPCPVQPVNLSRVNPGAGTLCSRNAGGHDPWRCVMPVCLGSQLGDLVPGGGPASCKRTSLRMPRPAGAGSESESPQGPAADTWATEWPWDPACPRGSPPMCVHLLWEGPAGHAACLGSWAREGLDTWAPGQG